MTVNDDAFRQSILAELTWDSRVDQSRVDVAVTDGVATLVGTVRSYAEKLAAQDATSSVEGICDLINDIDIKPAGNAHLDDARLTNAVEKVLEWDALIPEKHLTVAVDDGWVTIGGAVDVIAQSGEVEQAIARLAGVRGITNQITVNRPDVAPDDVRHAIRQALQRRAAHRASHIDVIVDGGSVTLRGTLQTALEKIAVLGAVGHAPGIELVCDELIVEPNS